MGSAVSVPKDEQMNDLSKKELISIIKRLCNKIDINTEIISDLMYTYDDIAQNQIEESEEIHSKNKKIDELKNIIISLQNENYFLINQLNYFMNENNALHYCMNQMTQFYHPNNIYPQNIEVEKQVEKQVEETKLVLITTFNGEIINDEKKLLDIFNFINQKNNVNSKECEVDSNKNNFIGGNFMMSLFNLIFSNQESIKALNVAKKGLLNQEIKEKQYQRQITLATLVFSNGETLIISASAVSRAYLYIHMSHMIEICGKCTCCWIWDEKLQEYQFYDSNCQSEIDFYTHKKQGCPGFKPKYPEKIKQ